MPKSNFITGQLIRWYESYNDDLALIKDTGAGVIVGVEDMVYVGSGGTTYEYTNFQVYRNKFNDIITLSESNIGLLKE